LSTFDDLLWTFADRSFVPHEPYREAAQWQEVPVLLSGPSDAGKRAMAARIGSASSRTSDVGIGAALMQVRSRQLTRCGDVYRPVR